MADFNWITMKKIYFIALFAALAVLCGCSTSVEECIAGGEVAQSELAIGLPIEVSRTMVDAEGRVSWVEGDTFALWAKKKSATSYAMSGVQFSMKNYWESYNSAVFTSKAEALDEGEYTYYAVSPMPSSVNAEQVKYELPVVQQGGSFNSAYDIMFAPSVVAEALSDAKLNALTLDFQHKMHVLKVIIAENNLGADISQLQFTFPKNTTGNVTINVKTGITSLSGGSKNLTIDVPEGKSVGDVAWGVIFPSTSFSGDAKLVAIGVDGRKSVEKTFTFNKKCEAGHITPLSLTVPNVCSTLRFMIGTNNLGEEIEKFTITDHNGEQLALNKLSDTIYDCVTDSDSATVFDSYEGKTFTATFESANAIVSSTFTMPSNLGGGVNVIPALTVPYLFEEDFSCIHTAGESYGDNGVADDERNQPGVSLDSYMSHKGWNAARFMLGVGTCPRINVRYQIVKIVMQFQSSHHGRLDTPQLTNLKSGANVKLRVQFDAGGVEYNGDFSGQDIIGIALATHTNSAATIDGIPTGSTGVTSQYETTLNDYGTTHFLQMMSSLYTTNDFGSTFPTLVATVYDVTSQTRLCFYPITTLQIDGIGNDECAVYIDNIKVSIAQ